VTSSLAVAHAALATPLPAASLPAVGVQRAAWLLLAFPMAGALILLLGGKRTNRWGHWIGVLMPVAAFVYAVIAFIAMLGYPANQRSRDLTLFTWIHVARFNVPVGLQLDQLSICFVLLTTGVGSLIHIFAVGYMSHDPERRRFFGYMNLFVASMLLLVLANNYLVLYVGWEGVGLASYLLIGFWFYNPAPPVAAKKAFVVNRVGDFGLTIAIMLMFATFGSVTFAGVFGQAGKASQGMVTALGLLLLLGACGKSAQLPLQSWLLDAMEGPTPVSALIHAATMVTAGVYLIVRSGPIFDLSPNAQLVVTIVGAATLLFGALISCAKDDIKKALAGSTMSQIGYMMLAAGLGPAGYPFAIIGVPPFSGFFAKDTIIDVAFEKGGTSGAILGTAALVGAGITAFYMTRVMYMTFAGERRWDAGAHPHEVPPIMTSPMILLAIGAVAWGGFEILGDRLAKFLGPVTGSVPPEPAIFSAAGIAALVLVAAGIALAWAMYGRRPVATVAPAAGPAVMAARKDLYGDAFNESVLMRPGQWLTRLSVYFDNRGVDGLVNTLAAAVGGTSGRMRRLQTGFVRSYALSMFIGAVLLVGAFLLVRV